MAMQESCDMAKAGISFCWAGFLSSILKNLGIDLFCDPIKEVILSSARDQWLSKISRDLPHTALSVRAVPDSERAGFKLFTFSKWFQVKCNVKETFWYNLSRPILSLLSPGIGWGLIG